MPGSWTVLLLAALLLTGCAQPPSLRSVIRDHYPGYTQILPAASIEPADPLYGYIPGALLTGTQTEAATRRDAGVWTWNSGYCPPGYALQDLSPRPGRSVDMVYDFGLSLRRLLHIRKARTDLALEENEIEVLRRVTIRVRGARSYRIMRNQRPRYAQACNESLRGHGDLRLLGGIVVGNVQVTATFKTNVSLLARLAVSHKIGASLGFGYLGAESYTATGDDLVFGARLMRPPQQVRLR
jgi:hypothetical protein